MKLDGLASEAIERLKSLQVEGRLTPNIVVTDAADPNSPLHDYFPWNDREAAEKHRLDVARRLIQSVRVVWSTETQVIRAPYYVRDPEAGADEQGYVAIPEITGERELAMRVVGRELDRIYAAVERARGAAGILGLGDVLEQMMEEILRHAAKLREAA